MRASTPSARGRRAPLCSGVAYSRNRSTSLSRLAEIAAYGVASLGPSSASHDQDVRRDEAHALVGAQDGVEREDLLALGRRRVGLVAQPQRADQPGDLVAERVQDHHRVGLRGCEHGGAHAGQRRQRVERRAYLGGQRGLRGAQVGDLVGDGGALQHQPVAGGWPEEIADREQPFLLELLDQRTDLTGQAGGPRGLGRALGDLRRARDHRHGERDHAEQRRDQQQRQLAADAEPTEQHRTAPSVRRRRPARGPRPPGPPAERRPALPRQGLVWRARPGREPGVRPRRAGRQGEDDDARSASSSASTPAARTSSRSRVERVPAGVEQPVDLVEDRRGELVAEPCTSARWTAIIDGSDAGRPAWPDTERSAWVVSWKRSRLLSRLPPSVRLSVSSAAVRRPSTRRLAE